MNGWLRFVNKKAAYDILFHWSNAPYDFLEYNNIHYYIMTPVGNKWMYEWDSLTRKGTQIQ